MTRPEHYFYAALEELPVEPEKFLTYKDKMHLHLVTALPSMTMLTISLGLPRNEAQACSTLPLKLTPEKGAEKQFQPG